MELGHIRQTDLQLALDIQASENSKRDLVKILIDQHLINEKTLLQIRALKRGLPYIEPEFSEIDRTLFSKAPIKWYAEHRLIPLQHEAQGTRIAFADPHNQQDLEAARQVYGHNLLRAVTCNASIELVIEWVKRGNKKEETVSSLESVAVKMVNKIILRR